MRIISHSKLQRHDIHLFILNLLFENLKDVSKTVHSNQILIYLLPLVYNSLSQLNNTGLSFSCIDQQPKIHSLHFPFKSLAHFTSQISFLSTFVHLHISTIVSLDHFNCLLTNLPISILSPFKSVLHIESESIFKMQI